jgi:hypothetical protein
MVFFVKGRQWAWLAALTNAALVAALSGTTWLIPYGVFVLTLALVLSESFQAGKSLFRSGVQALVAVALVGTLAVATYAQLHHVNPLLELKGAISRSVDSVVKMSAENPGSLGTIDTSDPTSIDEWKQGVMVEFPWVLGLIALMMVWANSLILLQRNPGGVRDRIKLDAQFARKWKAPEFLVWPTILSGVFLLFDAGRASDVSLNVFKFLMAIYALQGLSILAFVFEVWKLKRFFRTLGFLVSVLLMMPLLLSLGFFDLWFDFRGKFRQS